MTEKLQMNKGMKLTLFDCFVTGRVLYQSEVHEVV
jgi:hypothetical protein